MFMGYTYPLDPSWEMEEILVVMDLLTVVEKAYEGGIPSHEVAKAYQKYKDMHFFN